jgi:hypothetical protein
MEREFIVSSSLAAPSPQGFRSLRSDRALVVASFLLCPKSLDIYEELNSSAEM